MTTEPKPARRFSDALFMQAGACNPSGIAHTLVNACREVLAEGGDQRKDPAVRLIAHQLAWILDVAEVDSNLDSYRGAVDSCIIRADARTVEVTGNAARAAELASKESA